MPERREQLAETSRKGARLLWCGPTRGGEIGDCFAATAERSGLQVTAVGSGETLVEPDVGEATACVVACPRPEASGEAAAMVARATELGLPPGACVQLLGVWCEGEGRTGVLVPGVERVFWHAWEAWLDSQLMSAADRSTQGDGRLVSIHSRDAALAESLVEGLAGAGYAAVSERSVPVAQGAAAAVWSGAQLSGREADQLAELFRRMRPRPVIAMLDFPRPETVRATRALGAAAVLGKPASLELLDATLANALHAAYDVVAKVPFSPRRSTAPLTRRRAA